MKHLRAGSAAISLVKFGDLLVENKVMISTPPQAAITKANPGCQKNAPRKSSCESAKKKCPVPQNGQGTLVIDRKMQPGKATPNSTTTRIMTASRPNITKTAPAKCGRPGVEAWPAPKVM